MPSSVGNTFKPTKYIPVSTAATLLVGSTTLFFVFTLVRVEVGESLVMKGLVCSLKGPYATPWCSVYPSEV
ncbi:hypothetical protein NFI96_004982 [Prochilodus magdalenae]|nr:hypothetical protein NFI96_004982 [Prochilodus magdalenae]